MFKPFSEQPTKPGYYLWKNFNALYENNSGLNVFYLFENQSAALLGTDIKLLISHPFFKGYWLGPYEYDFIKRKIKNPAVLAHIYNFERDL
jgi:hypothetical protein